MPKNQNTARETTGACNPCAICLPEAALASVLDVNMRGTLSCKDLGVSENRGS